MSNYDSKLWGYTVASRNLKKLTEGIILNEDTKSAREALKALKFFNTDVLGGLTTKNQPGFVTDQEISKLFDVWEADEDKGEKAAVPFVRKHKGEVLDFIVGPKGQGLHFDINIISGSDSPAKGKAMATEFMNNTVFPLIKESLPGVNLEITRTIVGGFPQGDGPANLINNMRNILFDVSVEPGLKEAVLIRPIYEAKLPEITLGKFKIQIIGNFRSTNPFLAGNNQAVISVSIDGKAPKKFGTFKQGMIKIWAFPLRPKMSTDEQNKFDKFMDANWDKSPKLK